MVISIHFTKYNSKYMYFYFRLNQIEYFIMYGVCTNTNKHFEVLILELFIETWYF